MSYNINGNWKAGWALDLHTLKSVPLPSGGFDTTYTVIGKSLNLLKYHDEFDQIDILAKHVIDFMQTRMVTSYIDAIIPTPPSNLDRKIQPVYAIIANDGWILPTA